MIKFIFSLILLLLLSLSFFQFNTPEPQLTSAVLDPMDKTSLSSPAPQKGRNSVQNNTSSQFSTYGEKRQQHQEYFPNYTPEQAISKMKKALLDENREPKKVKMVLREPPPAEIIDSEAQYQYYEEQQQIQLNAIYYAEKFRIPVIQRAIQNADIEENRNPSEILEAQQALQHMQESIALYEKMLE